MWLIRGFVGPSVLVMLLVICGLECKPQNIDVSGLSNAELFEGLTGKQSTNEGTCTDTCVSIHMCDDERPNSATSLSSIVDERNFVQMGKGCSQDDVLKVCCKKVRETPKSITNTPLSNNECGIRNTNGLGVTVTGFKDGQSQYGEFPWMVAVYQDTKYVGGGSLVHPRVVLSAGHKIYDQSDLILTVRLGEWDNANENEQVPVQNIIVDKVMYPEEFYRPSHEYNVAILFLEEKAVLGGTVMPICLPAPNQVFADGTNCIVTGWGKDTFEGRFQSVMKAATVPVVNNIQCEAMLRGTRLGPDFTLHESFNCAGGNKEDACEGDGGSPLVCPNPNNPDEYVQMGIVSWGIGCGIPGNPGVYVNIPKTVEWINKEIDTYTKFTTKIDERVKPKP